MARLTLLALLALPIATLGAQGVQPPQPGERVRVYNRVGTFHGTLEDMDSAAVRLRQVKTDTTVTLPLNSTVRLEVQRGRQPAVGRGATLGGAIGGGVGLVLAALTMEDCDPGTDPGCMGAMALVGGAGVGALLGAGVGAIFGALSGQDRWIDVPLSPLRTSAAPGSGAMLIGWRLQF